MFLASTKMVSYFREIYIRTEMVNFTTMFEKMNCFFTFELNKRLVQKKKRKFCFEFRWLEILGILEEERFIPHSPGNGKSLFPISSFPEG